MGNLDDPEIARWLWTRLREAFPDALAATVMPDHPHVVTPYEDPAAAVVRLNRLLGQLGRKLGLGERAGIATPARVVDSVAELSRQLRYVGLNAPRKGLVECPLAWPWSSHRDAVGAIANPWIPASRLATALGDRKPRFVERYHAYVSADPSCDVGGTSMPQPMSPRRIAEVPLEQIAMAAASATRETIDAVRRLGPTRSLFVALAGEQGWSDANVLAARIGCSPRTVRRLGRRWEPALVDAGRLCLGDARLRRHAGSLSGNDREMARSAL